MKPRSLSTAILLLLPATLGAQPRERPLEERFDFTRPVAVHRLSRGLAEVSGLAVLPGGNVAAHGDEEARVEVLDPATGARLWRFHLGTGPVRGDFEGIAAIGTRLVLLTSRGWLYETRATQPGTAVGYRTWDADVGEGCDAEGLDFDPALNVLVVACKAPAEGGAATVIHRVGTSPDARGLPPLRIPWEALTAHGVEPELSPSGIAVDPSTGRYLLVAARQGLLLDLDPDGAIRSVVRLDPARHRQVEGVALGAGGALLLADEGRGGRARLTVYAPRTPES